MTQGLRKGAEMQQNTSKREEKKEQPQTGETTNHSKLPSPAFRQFLRKSA